MLVGYDVLSWITYHTARNEIPTHVIVFHLLCNMNSIYGFWVHKQLVPAAMSHFGFLHFMIYQMSIYFINIFSAPVLDFDVTFFGSHFSLLEYFILWEDSIFFSFLILSYSKLRLIFKYRMNTILSSTMKSSSNRGPKKILQNNLFLVVFSLIFLFFFLGNMKILHMEVSVKQ